MAAEGVARSKGDIMTEYKAARDADGDMAVRVDGDLGDIIRAHESMGITDGEDHGPVVYVSKYDAVPDAGSLRTLAAAIMALADGLDAEAPDRDLAKGAGISLDELRRIRAAGFDIVKRED